MVAGVFCCDIRSDLKGNEGFNCGKEPSRYDGCGAYNFVSKTQYFSDTIMHNALRETHL